MYRKSPPDHPAPSSPEAVLLAARSFDRMAQRLRGVVIVSSLLLGLGLGVAGYLMARDVQFSLMGGHSPTITGAVTIGITFPASLRLATYLSGVLVRWRSARWIVKIAARYQVTPEALEEYTRLLSG